MSNRWYLGVGEQSDIVVSTRIRLARNLNEYPFPNKLNTKSRTALNNIIKDAVEADNKFDLRFVEMKSLARFEAASMAERHIISPEFASDHDGRAVGSVCGTLYAGPLSSALFAGLCRSARHAAVIDLCGSG